MNDSGADGSTGDFLVHLRLKKFLEISRIVPEPACVLQDACVAKEFQRSCQDQRANQRDSLASGWDDDWRNRGLVRGG